MKINLANILKVLSILAAGGAAIAGYVEAINPTISSVIGVAVATVLAFTKAVQDSPLDDEPTAE